MSSPNSALESKKRKLAAESNEIPQNKKPATGSDINSTAEDPGKYRSLQKHLSMAFSKLSGASTDKG